MRLTSDDAAMPFPGDLVVQLSDKDLHDPASKVTNPPPYGSYDIVLTAPL